jgi:hypothetical protein
MFAASPATEEVNKRLDAHRQEDTNNQKNQKIVGEGPSAFQFSEVCGLCHPWMNPILAQLLPDPHVEPSRQGRTEQHCTLDARWKVSVRHGTPNMAPSHPPSAGPR